MTSWRAVFGFDERDAPTFDVVHARYRQILLNQPYPLEFEALRVLSEALEAAENELLAAENN